MDSVRYAIVDGAVVEDLLDFLSEYNPPHSCLYSEPLQPELVKLAPYLLEVTADVENWLNSCTRPWGIYLTTKVTMRTLRQHLRKFLQVLLPDETKPVIFRFYDPRNIWDFINVLSDWEKHLFLKNILKIETTYQHGQELLLDELHGIYPPDSRKKQSSKLMVITKAQYLQLEKVFERRYIEDLAGIMNSDAGAVERFSIDWAGKLFSYLRELGITDRRSIDEIAKLLSRDNIHHLSEIPTRYKAILEGTMSPGHYRTDLLLLDVYGEIPVWKRSGLSWG
ncbi:hypothetical protein M976_03718 [Buttiauxella ferragutiae ATCC 51602]|uniref:DUF4123 domain-containing protein n=1 Tax=Buttiauxella ferragutiae ATCC 51602 TaxID=1354252 RepID=A0ABX2W4G4_9ENTR|nr:DUF4123 domain-containing protein [Buttiauxella ferragutiae]OAT25575.1 hypothetical protein M976_03718 [Buttiauxella ferragutiae ATCC 51602]